MEKFITIRSLNLKCLEDGSCYVWKDECHKGKLVNPYWRQIGSLDLNGYIVYHSSKGGTIKLHRIIAAAFLGLDIEDKTMIVDHINGIKNDNRVSNLRVVNHTQNCMNYHNKEVKGITQRENGNWRAYINHNKARYSKTFKTLEEAKAWRQEKEIEFGYLHTSCL